MTEQDLTIFAFYFASQALEQGISWPSQMLLNDPAGFKHYLREAVLPEMGGESS